MSKLDKPGTSESTQAELASSALGAHLDVCRACAATHEVIVPLDGGGVARTQTYDLCKIGKYLAGHLAK